MGKSKKLKKKSSFESELVNTSDKSVKAFRHVANKKKNDDRRLQKKGKPGGRTGDENMQEVDENMQEGVKKCRRVMKTCRRVMKTCRRVMKTCRRVLKNAGG